MPKQRGLGGDKGYMFGAQGKCDFTLGCGVFKLHHSHSNTGSRLHLRSTLRVTAMPDP